MQSAYRHDRGTYGFVRKMMALPFLLKREIRPMFEALRNEASATLLEFSDFVSSTWISGSTWKPTDWTCYTQAIRTSNDIEGCPPWPKSPSVWTNTTSSVPSDPASSQGSEADSNYKNCRQQLPISSSPLLELRVFTFYLKFTNLTTQVDLLFLPAVAPPNSFPAI